MFHLFGCGRNKVNGMRWRLIYSVVCNKIQHYAGNVRGDMGVMVIMCGDQQLGNISHSLQLIFSQIRFNSNCWRETAIIGNISKILCTALLRKLCVPLISPCL